MPATADAPISFLRTYPGCFCLPFLVAFEDKSCQALLKFSISCKLFKLVYLVFFRGVCSQRIFLYVILPLWICRIFFILYKLSWKCEMMVCSLVYRHLIVKFGINVNAALCLFYLFPLPLYLQSTWIADLLYSYCLLIKHLVGEMEHHRSDVSLLVLHWGKIDSLCIAFIY